MHITTILSLTILSALGAAESNVDRDDVPSACLASCQSTIDLSQRCDRQTDDDNIYRGCVCGAQDAQRQMDQCAACVRVNGMSGPVDNDVAELMNDCGWDFNTASGSATAVTSMTSRTTAGSTPTPVVSTSTGASTTATITQTPTGASGSGATESSTTNSDNAAPAATAGLAGLLVAAGAAVALF
ncbi:hypothetical protein DL766_007887 [Monosporascus sp. MC13-8B]|uniref:Extracellular membrane protein CFEM domain-containing protein n=1 Tax=Monosporascus cannonballus TaxID=155416 RepID=A0ABY0HCR9_9PEZI|nr:hypothetical protein DL762_002728 [Monosporascus cannonballus]RYO97640.1 hypothetical protein DL763_002617 [Monosporascus cannonballus]RYP21715.1 hypothetical protein DL766_007887 [Monosporascus sp. MC13-8B]